ncbi:hypothetical protein NNJEOMEG_00135 [Fundidesulfovibrio magnetotacticus]|uniref:Uncharacterized protein n=1 Tax=Fundidesulfovibrio magnetotacticus TaxID=2730080 RepID=A0A6V8LHV9_9BACT|nr:hypothetical protein [Fundidesulfovibrio magnetotacticus]GFK92312.1 hypothetical protein NNJEOMEG_00135 [Fundidesulfovibrio magnetotacticus]
MNAQEINGPDDLPLSGDAGGSTAPGPSGESGQPDPAVLAAELKAVRLLLEERNRELSALMAKEDALRRELREKRSAEHAAMEELAFLTREQARQDNAWQAASAELEDNVLEIEKGARRLEFARGELEALDRQLESRIGDLPELVSCKNDLEDRISQATAQFGDIMERLSSAAKGFKLSYYQRRSQLRGKHAAY